MSSPIFDSTFGTGRFRYDERATKSPEPQDVRQALELQLFDLVELARDTRSDKGGEAKWVHPCGALVKEFAKRIAALAQSPMSEWQKIETAPKDGRLVIVWESADRVYSASWWSAERWADENGGEPDEYQEGWFTDDEDELGPSYWMPLPEPPRDHP